MAADNRSADRVMLLEALKRAARELERYIDLQQKLDYIEYAATTQKELAAVNAVIAKAEGRP